MFRYKRGHFETRTQKDENKMRNMKETLKHEDKNVKNILLKFYS